MRSGALDSRSAAETLAVSLASLLCSLLFLTILLPDLAKADDGLNPVFGTCCLENGDCMMLTREDCSNYGGRWIGPGVSCDQCFLWVPPTLDEIQDAIADQGKAWQAAENDIWNLPWSKIRAMLGAKLPRDSTYTDQGWITQNLPASFDWRDVGGKNYVSPVKNQGWCGSCWAFAAVGVLESLLMIQGYNPCWAPNLSEQFVVSCNSGCLGCFGGWPRTTARFMKKLSGVHYGAPDEACFLYTSGKDHIAPPCANACNTWSLRNRAIDDWKWIRSSRYHTDGAGGAIDSMKSAIYEGPVWTTMTVMSDFPAYDGGVYEYATGDVEGGHAILCFGWDDDEECFLCKNSWGTDWGEEGFFRIGYSQIDSPVNFGEYTIFYVLNPPLAADCDLYEPQIGGMTEWIAGTFRMPMQQDEQMLDLGLPFPFKYFCHWFDRAGLSSNGWMSMGSGETDPWYAWFPIPSPEGPPAMIAPMWTDLDPSELMGDSGIYTTDTGDGRFVVEYRNVQRWNRPERETFEMVLYDPVRYPTATGEGRIRFQYLQHDPQQTFHTVGIENGTEQCGVEIWNDGVWPPLGPAPGPALASVRAPSSNDPMKLSRFQSGAEAQAGGHAEEGEREETPIVPGMQIDFEPVAHGDEFAPLPPSALAVDYLEPDVRISWTNPTHNTNGVELTYLDHVCLSQDGQMMAEVLGEPGESMQYELRGAGSGTHLYAVYACVGEQESGPAQQAFTVPQVAHYRDNPPNNVVLTVTDQGTCGFLNADPQQGSGFRFGPGGANCLFVGSLWAATGPYYALNNDYADDAYQDWRFLKSYGAGNDPASLIAGCDDAGHYGAAGLEVWQQTRSWPDPPNNDFVMIDYNLRNTSDERIENLYVGQFMDWDIGDAMNQGRANAATNMAYMYKDASSPYAGVALLGESPANLALIHNPTFVWPQASILDLDRFFFLAAADGDHSVSQTWETNDWSAVVSVGPIVLEPGAMRRVSFAVIGGANEADLIANAQAAQQKYASAPSSIEEPVPATAFTTDLLPVQPNPFGASATIRYRLATAGPVTLAIYDAGGRLVRRWSEPARTVGEHAVVWDGRDDQGSVQPSGIYFCTIRADGQTRTEKMILLRARR